MLEYHSYIFPDFVDIDMFVRKIRSVYNDLAGGDFFQFIHTSEKSGFTTSGRTDDNYHFAFINICRNIFQNFQSIKVLFQMGDMDFCFSVICVHDSVSFLQPWQVWTGL